MPPASPVGSAGASAAASTSAAAMSTDTANINSSLNESGTSAQTTESFSPITTVRASDATDPSTQPPNAANEAAAKVEMDARIVRLAAAQLINRTLDAAVEHCVETLDCVRPAPIQVTIFDRSKAADRETFYDMSFDRAVQVIASEQFELFIRSWVWRRLDNPLKWCLKLCRLMRQQNQLSFVLEAKFSAPTPANPVPQSTAHVYFWFEVEEFDWPLVQRVCVPFAYQFEGSVFMHQPLNYGRALEFQENLLYRILADKSRLFEQLKF